MPRITLKEIAALQSQTDNIRNVCFLAHVDHGKTTLSDHLISWNGIISSKNAGNLRYLDSRPDEQERQITMKSSSISLVYMPRKAKLPFLVNLVDSPGHVDFSNEASTAVRLCDGALVLVDVLEGICVQTISVLKQAWNECVKPILVLNKMDRLKTELNMNAMEAYSHIDKLIGRINALVSTFATGEAFKKIHDNDNDNDNDTNNDNININKKKKKKNKLKDKKDKRIKIDTSKYTVQLDSESQWFFSPNKGNVIFCSAKHKWGFTIESIAQYYHKTKNMNRKVLKNTLWGNYYFYKKDNIHIHKKPYKHHILPMFVEFILGPIWSIYDNVYINYHSEEFKKWIKKLKLIIPQREIDNHKDTTNKMIALMSRWMPISKSVLDIVIKYLPSPKEAQKQRLPSIWNIEHLSNDLINALKTCDSNYKHCVIYIPKMVHVQRNQIENALINNNNQDKIIQRSEYKRGKYNELKLQKNKNYINNIINDIINNVILISNKQIKQKEKKKEENSDVINVSNIWERFMEPEIIYFDDENETHNEIIENKTDSYDEISILNGLFIGLGRIYCGTISENSNIHIFGPRHHSGELDHYKISGYKLFHFMGKDIGHISSISSGNICGIGGIHNYLQKSGFITNNNLINVPMVKTISRMSFPVVRVAIEPQKYKQFSKLKLGLKLLNKCDTGVEIFVQSNGEYIICASGELHLERCLRDLKDLFAKNIQLNISKPLVSFKESVVNINKQELIDRKIYIKNNNNNNNNIDYIDTMFGKRYDHIKIIKNVLLNNNNKSLQFSIEAISLKYKLIEFIDNNKDIISDLIHFLNQINENNIINNNNNNNISNLIIEKYKIFENKLSNKLSSKMNIYDIVSFGPRSIGTNILFIKSKKINKLMLKYYSLFYKLNNIINKQEEKENEEENNLFNLISQAIQNGFQSITSRGPLCGEPMYGVGFIIDDIKIIENNNNNNNNNIENNKYDNRLITTNIMTNMREACINSFLSLSPRLVEPMYKVFIQGTTEVLGSIYDVIQKRKGKITGDSIVEGTNLFDIYALLPVIQSFGFCDELRTQTAGNVIPQLTFSHWSIIDIDPLYIPLTQNDENQNDNNNDIEYVKKLIINVRKRKGLQTDQKTVESAEKQSNISRKK